MPRIDTEVLDRKTSPGLGSCVLNDAVVSMVPIAPQFGPLSDGAELVRIGVVADGPQPRLSVDAHLQLDVAFADEDLPVYDENVPGVLLELREYVAALIGRFEPRFG